MRFGDCVDCTEYKYLEKNGKCPSCLDNTVEIYKIQSAVVSDALRELKDRSDVDLSESPKPSYETLVDEIIDNDVADAGVKVTGGVLKSFIENLKEHKNRSPVFAPSVPIAIRRLENIDSVDELDLADFVSEE